MSKKISNLDSCMYKGYKLRIYPTKEQIHQFRRYFGMVRFVYNLGKDIYDDYYNSINNSNDCVTKRKTLYHSELNNIVTKLKNEDDEYLWLREYDSKAITIVLKDLIDGYNMFYRGATKHLPKYKAKRHANQSFPTRKDRMSILGNQLWLSSFTEPITIKKVPKELQGFGTKHETNRPRKKFEGYNHLEYCNPRISFDGVKYYLSFTLVRTLDNSIYDYNSTKKFKYNKDWANKEQSDVIGMDFGCRHDNWFVTSDGRRLYRPNQSKIEKQLAGRQRKLARQQRINKKKRLTRTSQYTAKNEEKTKVFINKSYKKHVNQRNYIMNNFINDIIDTKPEAIVLETIFVSDIMECGNPLLIKNVKDSIHCRSLELIKYKCNANGIKVIMAPEGFKSTQICSRCNHEHKPGSKRIYKCHHCGLVIDRDLNAAINLQNYGNIVLHGMEYSKKIIDTDCFNSYIA